MASLRETISSMRTEITELRETVKEMSTKCSCSQNHDRSSSDSAWKCVERAVRGGRVRGGKSGAGGGKGRNGVCGEGGVLVDLSLRVSRALHQKPPKRRGQLKEFESKEHVEYGVP